MLLFLLTNHFINITFDYFAPKTLKIGFLNMYFNLCPTFVKEFIFYILYTYILIYLLYTKTVNHKK